MRQSHDNRLLPWLPRLRRYAQALTHNRDDADDLVQDTLERAWAKSAHWPLILDMRAWLFSIMHNLYIDGVRRPRVPVSEMAEHDASVEAHHDKQLTLMDLQAALRHLPPEQKEVVLLVALEDMAYADIAHILNIPVGTVMSRLSRGRERLRLLMEGPRNSVHVTRVK